jgi:hypothetical protein
MTSKVTILCMEDSAQVVEYDGENLCIERLPHKPLQFVEHWI